MPDGGYRVSVRTLVSDDEDTEQRMADMREIAMDPTRNQWVF